jgi:hypothetical protein
VAVQSIYWDCYTLEDGTNMLFRNVDSQLSTYATQHPRTANTSNTRVTWLITLGRGGRGNRLWILWTSIYVGVKLGARGGAVGWGTAPQAGRSRVQFQMVSLEFFIDITLPAALWPWGTHSL